MDATTISTNLPDRLVFTVHEVSDRLRISHAQVYRELQSGRLRSLTIGRRRLVSHTALMEYIADRERDSAR